MGKATFDRIPIFFYPTRRLNRKLGLNHAAKKIKARVFFRCRNILCDPIRRDDNVVVSPNDQVILTRLSSILFQLFTKKTNRTISAERMALVSFDETDKLVPLRELRLPKPFQNVGRCVGGIVVDDDQSQFDVVSDLKFGNALERLLKKCTSIPSANRNIDLGGTAQIKPQSNCRFCQPVEQQELLFFAELKQYSRRQPIA